MSFDTGLFKMDSFVPQSPFECTSPRAPSRMSCFPYRSDGVDLSDDLLKYKPAYIKQEIPDAEKQKLIQNIRVLLPDLPLEDSMMLPQTPVQILRQIQRLAITEATIRKLVQEKEHKLSN